MKPSRIFLSVTMLMLALLFALPGTTAIAAAKKPTVPVVADVRKLIQSVDVAAGTVIIQYMRDKSTHTYKIDDFTKLTVNNIAGKVADIKPGMEVFDYAERDGQTLDSLTVRGYGTETAPAAPKKKKK